MTRGDLFTPQGLRKGSSSTSTAQGTMPFAPSLQRRAHELVARAPRGLQRIDPAERHYKGRVVNSLAPGFGVHPKGPVDA
jgi:hypothetical protein